MLTAAVAARARNRHDLEQRCGCRAEADSVTPLIRRRG